MSIMDMQADAEERFARKSPRARLRANDDAEASTSDRTLWEDLGLVPSPEKLADLARALERVQTAAVRGAAAGALIKGGLHTLTFIMHVLSHLRGKGRQRMMTLGGVLKDTCVYTCFLAILGSSYTLVDEAIALVFGKESTQKWRALVAGLVAGQSLRITGPRQRHYSLATYILLRGLTLLVRTGNKPSAPPALRALLRPTRLAHGDTLLMCVAASQILYSFIMEPSTLPPSYVRFIYRIGGKDPAVWGAFREHALRNARGRPPGPLASLARTHLAYLNAKPGRLRATPCEFFHPGQSCAGHAVSVLPQAYSTALAIYVPFYAVSSVLVHRTALLRKPAELLPKMAVGVLRSSAFLASYMAVAFAGACAGFSVAGVNTGPVIAASVWVGGLATLIEKKSRRMELAMYCAARALEAFIRCWRLWTSPDAIDARRCARAVPVPASALAYIRPPGVPGGLPPLPPRPAAPPSRLRLDVLLFSLGCGAIAHCYSDACGQHRDVFRSKYLNVLDFVFGNEGVQRGSISHVPTNLQLVSNVSRRIRTMSMGVLSHAPSGASSGALGDYSPLQRSAEQSHADGLYALRGGSGGGYGSGNFGGGFGGGAGHGGGELGAYAYGQGHEQYSQYAQHASAVHAGYGVMPSPYGAVAAAAAGLPAMGPMATLDAASALPVGESLAMRLSGGGSATSLPLSPVHGLTGHGSMAMLATVGEEGGDAVQMAAARLAAQQSLLARHIQQHGLPAEDSEEPVPPGAARSHSGGSSDGASSSCSGWEDVVNAATGSAPNAADGAAATTTGGTGAFGWATRLVSGALSGSRSGSRAGSSAALAAAAEAAAADGNDALPHPRGVAVPGSGGGMRRIATAPQVLALLSDPESERSGRGRCSYQLLQELGGNAPGAGAAPPPDGAAAGGAAHPVPVAAAPAAANRPPVFRPAAGAGGGGWNWARPLRRGPAGGSMASGMDQLASSAPTGSQHSQYAQYGLEGTLPGGGGDTATGLARAGSEPQQPRQRPRPSGLSLSLAPRGGWAHTHTSPVQGAAAWPRLAADAAEGGVAGLGAVAESEETEDEEERGAGASEGEEL